MITPEEYLRARGWRWDWDVYDGGQPCSSSRAVWYDPMTGKGWYEDEGLSKATAIQVARDANCTAFVKAYLGAEAGAAFDELMGDNNG